MKRWTPDESRFAQRVAQIRLTADGSHWRTELVRRDVAIFRGRFELRITIGEGSRTRRALPYVHSGNQYSRLSTLEHASIRCLEYWL